MGPFSIPLSGFDWNCADTHTKCAIRTFTVIPKAVTSNQNCSDKGQDSPFPLLIRLPVGPEFSAPSGRPEGIALMKSRALHSRCYIEWPLKEPGLFNCKAVSTRGSLSSLGYHHAHLGPLLRGEAQVASLDPLVHWVLGNTLQLRAIHVN